jgi:hypothetical protein
LKDYIDFLKANDGRIMISPSDAKMLNKIKQNILHHKAANNIIWPLGHIGDYSVESYGETKNMGCPTFHEFHINWEWEMLLEHSGDSNPPELLQVKCKSLLDGLTLDFKNKKAIIYDLKTTQKLWHFEDSIDQYDYLRQLCYYMQAVNWYLKNECNEDPIKWKFDFYIIGIDTTGTNEIRVFHFNQSHMLKSFVKIHDALTEIAWHQMNDKWEHSRAYYEGDGSETLNL